MPGCPSGLMEAGEEWRRWGDRETRREVYSRRKESAYPTLQGPLRRGRERTEASGWRGSDFQRPLVLCLRKMGNVDNRGPRVRQRELFKEPWAGWGAGCPAHSRGREGCLAF